MAVFSPPTYTSASVKADEISFVFGRNVKRMRTDQGLNKKSFALICGISRPLLDEIERGTSDVRLSYVQKIADALSVKPSRLLTSDPSEFKPFL